MNRLEAENFELRTQVSMADKLAVAHRETILDLDAKLKEALAENARLQKENVELREIIASVTKLLNVTPQRNPRRKGPPAG